MEALLLAARESRAEVLQICGEAGIGKTMLCQYAVSCAEGMTALWAAGAEFEAGLPLAGLVELLWPLRHRIPELPRAQHVAARALLGAEDEPVTDLFTLGAVVLALLTLQAEDQPVLVVVEDVHWLDSLSGRALAFAFRRLRADAVAVLLTRRTSEPNHIPGPWPELKVEGLGPNEVAQLLEAVTGTRPTPGVAEHITRVTAGNPLAVLECARTLTPVQLSGRVQLPDPLPLGERGLASFGTRLSALPPSCKAALSVVAVAGACPAAVIRAALQETGSSYEDLEPAEKDGVIAIIEGSPVFSHPLVRSAAVARLTHPERRRMHAAVAKAMSGVDLERQAWHLASATAGPSEEVAVALEAAAERTARRGGLAASATALSLAAHLSPAGPARTDRLARAGQALALAGRRHEASAMLQDLRRIGDDDSRVRALILEAELAMWEEHSSRVTDLLSAALAELTPRAPEPAALIAIQLSVMLDTMGHLEQAVITARQAVQLQVANPQIRAAALSALAVSSLLRGDRAPLRQLDRDVAADALESLLDPANPAMSALTYMWVFAERFDTAYRYLDRQIIAARRKAAPSLLPFPLTLRCDLQSRCGNLPPAACDAEESLELDEMIGAGLRSYSHALRARVAALQGETLTCRTQAARALELAAPLGHSTTAMYVNHALGLLELGAGRPAAAVTHLSKNLPLEAAIGLRLPVAHPWKGDYVEAPVRTGRVDDAREVLDDLEGQSRSSGSGWGKAVSMRCTALLEDPSWEQLALESIDRFEQLPLEQARAQLVLGEKLRRARRINEARRHLAAAAETFTRCGATPWTDQARREFHAAGGRGIAKATPSSELTGQEFQVCHLASDGATNKEIASALFMSTKTVEYHLQKAFQKLGIRNRTEIARHLPAAHPEGHRRI